jgi:hypothetical protein
MHTFSLHFRHESPDGPWIASCPVQADLEDFSGLTRLASPAKEQWQPLSRLPA